MGQNVRYFYRTEVTDDVERVFTVAYTHDKQSGSTQYGGAVFRHAVGDTKESFKKEPHRKTAFNRLTARPLSLNVQADNYQVVEDKIRDMMRDRAKAREPFAGPRVSQ
jgi:hypothetical protein